MSDEFIDKIKARVRNGSHGIKRPQQVLYNGVTLYDVAEAVIAYRDTIIKYTGESQH